MKARNWTSTMVTAVDLDLPASPGVNFSDTGSEWEWRQHEFLCRNVWKRGEVQWTLIRRAEIVLSDRCSGGSQEATLQNISLWGGGEGGSRVRSALRQKTSPLQDSPLLHFSAESLRPRSTGTVINSVKTALRYLLYPKVVFIDWNFPELIWANIKFTIHTQSSSK